EVHADDARATRDGRLPDQRLGSRRLSGPHRVHAPVQRRTHRGRRVGGRPGADPARPGEARARGQGRRAGHRRAVRGGEGVPRRLLDRGGRPARARLRAGGPGVGGAGPRRRPAQHADRGAPGDERPPSPGRV
ncbi:MAG: hypothetical protein AVDCRST_MAG11-2002, partial [uncultured Gemmatimonadaceae bacterium]